MRTITVAALAATCLAGCSGPDTNPTMTLLRAGDTKVCVASDIEDTLRRLILPEGNAEAAKGYMISFDRASLEGFDKAVGKASCNAWVKIDGPDGVVVEATPVDYTITPSAQNTDTFLVSGPTAPLRQQIDADIERRASDADTEESRQARERALNSMVKPRWLTGRWVDADAGSDACTTGPYMDFAPKGVFETENGSGRWSLDGTQITVTGNAKTVRQIVTEADINSFYAMTMDETGAVSSLRRCNQQEILQSVENTDADAQEVERLSNALPDISGEQQ